MTCIYAILRVNKSIQGRANMVHHSIMDPLFVVLVQDATVPDGTRPLMFCWIIITVLILVTGFKEKLMFHMSGNAFHTHFQSWSQYLWNWRTLIAQNWKTTDCYRMAGWYHFALITPMIPMLSRWRTDLSSKPTAQSVLWQPRWMRRLLVLVTISSWQFPSLTIWP